MFELKSEIELTNQQLCTIAAAMKEMSAVDGEVHPDELAMIDQLLEGLDGVDSDHVNLMLFSEPQHKDILLKSVALVALADGKIMPEETALLERYSLDLGLENNHGIAIMREVGMAMLSYFRGVSVTRPKMEEIGRQLGLDATSIALALDPK